MALFKKQGSDSDFHAPGGLPIHQKEGVPCETQREACYVLSEMHHLFLISPTPIRGRTQRGRPSAVFASGLGWKNEEDGD